MFLTTWHMTLFFYCAISNRRRNIKYKTIKLIEDDLEENLGGIGAGNLFLDTTPKAQSVKEEKKLDLIKMKNVSLLQKTLLR